MAGSFETPEDLPRALRSWAGRCLSDESAPLLTSVLLTWACDATDEASRVQWRELNDLCRDSEFGFGHSRTDAVEERDRSRAADASLGTGPVMVDFSPPEPQGASEATEGVAYPIGVGTGTGHHTRVGRCEALDVFEQGHGVV